ncbi:MAG: hypothetical protein KDB79_08655 [Acidobacteria bacterium]|nr:hypothetical protein [Acidobacteriota bacterium]
MKICPQCRSNYTDDTLQFCLQDGTTLEFAGGTSDHNTSDMKTVSFEESATIVSRRPPEKITFNLEDPPEVNSPAEPGDRSYSTESVPASSNTLLVVLATASAMIVLFGIVGIGAWFFLLDNGQRVQKNSNNSLASANKPENNAGADPEKTPRSANTPDSSNNSSPQKTPAFDRDKLIEGVGKQISTWKSMAESRNLDGYMSSYAPRLDYYNRRGAGKDFVRQDKQKAFSAYTSIKTKLSNIVITPGSDGNKATAVFDKEWDFSGPDKKTSGKVKTQLIFGRSGDKWLIVSERDLKVYYVNK